MARDDGQKFRQINFRRDERSDDFMDADKGKRTKHFINGGRTMTFSIRAVFLLSGAALLVTGCGNDSKAANEDNFEAALNAHLSLIHI